METIVAPRRRRQGLYVSIRIGQEGVHERLKFQFMWRPNVHVMVVGRIVHLMVELTYERLRILRVSLNRGGQGSMMQGWCKCVGGIPPATKEDTPTEQERHGRV